MFERIGRFRLIQFTRSQVLSSVNIPLYLIRSISQTPSDLGQLSHHFKPDKKMSSENIQDKAFKKVGVEGNTNRLKANGKLKPLIDEHGFKRRQVYIDAETLSAYDQMGGDANKKGMPKNKTMREEDEDTHYIIDGPLRRVAPYYFTYLTHCKERWRDRKVLEVFSTEFRLFPKSYYENALNNGRVSLNNKVANVNSVIRNGDLITHRMHRHEPPVTSRPIKIIHQDDNYVIVDKPSGIPVHPTGRYRHNTVTFVLEHEMGIKAHPCNRLDRLTSGIMVLGKNGKAADRMSRAMRERQVQKQYIAKVVGEFPPNNDGIVVDKSLSTVDPRLAFNAVDEAKGKPAKTFFKRIAYDGKTSLVICKPLTGRTHQIRVHLQYLGHPIINDPLYSSPEIWGPTLGKGGEFDIEQIKSRLAEVGKTKPATSWLYPKAHGEVLSGKKCEICQGELYEDPGPNDLDLYLHAYKYASKDSKQTDNSEPEDGSKLPPWSFHTEFPEWALKDQKKFMQMAIEEAKKCGPTTTAFCVGALLVNGGKVISTGYSRELEGNTHAEQNALAKYFRRTGKEDVPPGTELYTTMEPCSKRLSGNLPCLNRILKLRNHITTCFVGVMEPSTFVAKNVSYEQLTNAGISYIKISGFEEEALKAAKKGHKDHIDSSN